MAVTVVVAEGLTYNYKDIIKTLGFKWDSTEKSWTREMSDDDIDDLDEYIRFRTDGNVKIRCVV